MYQAKSHLNQIPVMYRAAEDEPVGGRIGFLFINLHVTPPIKRSCVGIRQHERNVISGTLKTTRQTAAPASP